MMEYTKPSEIRIENGFFTNLINNDTFETETQAIKDLKGVYLIEDPLGGRAGVISLFINMFWILISLATLFPFILFYWGYKFWKKNKLSGKSSLVMLFKNDSGAIEETGYVTELEDKDVVMAQYNKLKELINKDFNNLKVIFQVAETPDDIELP